MTDVKGHLLPPVCFCLALAALPGRGIFSSDDMKPRFPLDDRAGIVASFGEYRPDHLHPGVDFSTGGRTGLPVHAVEAGRIFRLKVEWRGYGRALYLQHADGRVSVYAHLERYEDRRLGLERRVSEERQKRGLRYPGDIYLDPPVPVRRGDIVGFTGESGAGLPHLHYEMRREDQEPADPLVPGWIRESEPPVFESIIFRADSPETWVDGNRVLEMRLSRTGTEGVYTPGHVAAVSGPFLPEASLYSRDREGHRLGIKSLRVRVDGVTTYHFQIESFRFSQYPEVGLLLDHARSSISPPAYTYLLSRLKGNELGGSSTMESPWPRLFPGEHRLEVEAGGPAGGVSRAIIPFRVFAPVELRWKGASFAGSPMTLHFSVPRSKLGPRLRVSYQATGSAAEVECEGRDELPDGETCRLAIPERAAGVTAKLFQGPDLLGRATLFFPGDPASPPAVPRIRMEPSRRFVDLNIFVGEGEIPPARLVLETGSERKQLALVELAPDTFLGTVPADAWKGARSIRLEWETASRSGPAALAVAPHYASIDAGLNMDDCGVQFQVEPHSLYDDTPVQCDSAGPFPPPEEEMVLLGGPVRLLPTGTPLSHKGSLSFPSPADPHPERIGVYRLEPVKGIWLFEGSERGEDGIRVPVGRLDTFALLRDDSPPRILGVDPSGRETVASPRSLLRVRVADRGSGLNYDGVHLFLDGRELETEYDPDRGWSTVSPGTPLSSGKHEGRVWAVDRAGNRSSDLVFEVRVR